MSGTSQYQGSQAYAQNIPSEESISPNSGSLNYTKTLVDLRGKSAAIGLQVQLSYAPGAQGSFGLPKNWGFDLPFTIPGKSLTAQGKTYVVDPDWNDQTDYRSGLRYVNNHGMLFEHIFPALPLPSDPTKSYEWRFRRTDGTLDYFDTYGKVLEHADLYGNSILFAYRDELSDPSTAQLETITDSWKQTVSFTYDMDAATYVTAPDGGKSTITFGGQGVSQITDSMGYVTTFDYNPQGSQTVINNIGYPSGLQSNFEYTMLAALDGDGNPISVPACSRHTHLDSARNLLNDTQYWYGQATGYANFTGHTLGCKMGSTGDALMDSNNQDFRYDILMKRMDSSGKAIQMSQVYYNYLHLSMQEDHWNNVDAAKPSNRSTNDYLIPIDLHARASSYSQPIQIDQLHLVGSGYQLLRRAKSSYDDFGCPLLQTEEMWEPMLNTTVLQRTIKSTYTTTSWKGQLLATESYVDNVTGHEKLITYTLTDDQRSTAKSVIQHRDSGNVDWLAWKTKSYQYDATGRVTNETVAWSDGAIRPPDTVTNYDYQKTYLYDENTHICTEKTTDPLNITGSMAYDMRIKGGPLVLKTSPLGNVESMEYDLAGRVVKQTDANKDVTTTTISVGVLNNYVENKTALGYITRTTFDALGRGVEMSDNGDISLNHPTRVLAQTTYDAVGQVVTQVDEQKLKTTQTFDAMNRLLSCTDYLGNVTTNEYDDQALTVTVKLNGDLRSVDSSDSLGRKWKSITYGDSGATNPYVLVSEQTYDGFGKVLTNKSSQQTTAQPPVTTILSSSQCVYNVEDKPITISSAALPSTLTGSNDTLVRQLTLDIFGNTVSASKTATYADGRTYTHAAPTRVYDADRRMVRLIDQLGKSEVNDYDNDSRLTTLTRIDGSKCTYGYDAIGHQTSTTTLTGTTSFEYLSNGRLSTIQKGDKKITHTYSLDGSIKQTTYPDGKTQTYVLDGTSRVIQEIDAAGESTINTYDNYGRLATKQLKDSKITYQFGTVNHTYGAPVGYSVASSQSYSRVYTFDGFGRIVQAIDKDPSGNLLLSATYLFDSRGRMLGHELTSGVYPNFPDLNRQQMFQYDGLGQLISDVKHFDRNLAPHSTLQYQYDGNYNIVQQIQNGVMEARTYNAIDQRVDAGFVYDANGRLTSDPTGRKYTFDTDDRLLSVTGIASVDSKYTYNPDDSMTTQQTKPGSENKFYYSGGAVNTTMRTDSGKSVWTSFLVQPQGRVAAHTASSPTATQQSFVESRDSVVLTLHADGADTSDYSAYGTSTKPQQSGPFGWLQEVSDDLAGLLYLRSRFYSPLHRSFLSMDSARDQENRYAYCTGDPINHLDSTGHDASAQQLAIVGGVVSAVIGIAISVASFGTLAWLGLTQTATSLTTVGVGAATVSGSLGSLAGDAASAAIQHQSFSAARAGEDLLTGGVGGFVGSASGGLASVGAMRLATTAELSVNVTTATGFATSSVVGGGMGSFASSGTSAALHHDPLFSTNTAFAALMGAGVGAAGAVLAGGAHLGIGRTVGNQTLPVEMRESELHLIISPRAPMRTDRIFAMSHAQEHVNDFAGATDDVLRTVHGANPPGDMHYAIIAHGDPGRMYATVRYRNEEVYRPINATLVAKAAQADPDFRRGVFQLHARGYSPAIKLISCNGGYGNAQKIANALGVRVWAAYTTVSVKGTGYTWVGFTPK